LQHIKIVFVFQYDNVNKILTHGRQFVALYLLPRSHMRILILGVTVSLLFVAGISTAGCASAPSSHSSGYGGGSGFAGGNGIFGEDAASPGSYGSHVSTQYQGTATAR
jgi:hypothetical protein